MFLLNMQFPVENNAKIIVSGAVLLRARDVELAGERRALRVPGLQHVAEAAAPKTRAGPRRGGGQEPMSGVRNYA